MNHWFIGAAVAFIAGVCVSFINYRIALLVAHKKPQAFPMTSVIRQFVNVAYLAAVYFIAPLTPWKQISMLVGAALGATISMLIFTYLLVKESGGGHK